MLYTLEQGPTERRVIELAMQAGHPLPKKIQFAPDLQIGLEMYYGAFLDLSSCRFSGMGEGPIPWLAIHEYCKHYEIEDDEERRDMFHHVRSMDLAYLKHMDKKRG